MGVALEYETVCPYRFFICDDRLNVFNTVSNSLLLISVARSPDSVKYERYSLF